MQLAFDTTAFINSIPSGLLIGLGLFVAIWSLAMVITMVVISRE